MQIETDQNCIIYLNNPMKSFPVFRTLTEFGTLGVETIHMMKYRKRNQQWVTVYHSCT